MALTPLQHVEERLRRHGSAYPRIENYGSAQRDQEVNQAKKLRREAWADRWPVFFGSIGAVIGFALGVAVVVEQDELSLEDLLLALILAPFAFFFPAAWVGHFVQWLSLPYIPRKSADLVQFENDRKHWFAKRTEIQSERQKLLDDERKKHRDYWLNLTSRQFEREVASLFEKRGYQASVVGGAGDKGVDIELRNSGRSVVVQCKAHAKPISPGVVRELLGTKIAVGAERAILVALSGATSGAESFAQENKIEIVDLDRLIEMAKGARAL